MRDKLIYIFLFLFAVLTAASEIGIPFITNFAPREYRASNQNWAITQHSNGFIYSANSKGVLEYDGSQWRLIPLANNAAALSITTAPNNIIFVGGKKEFGYLTADSTGAMVYISLLDHLSSDDRDFGDVWETIAIEDYVYFRSKERLFRLTLDESAFQSTTIKSWTPKNGFHFSFDYNGKLLIRDIEHGLFVIDSDSLRPLPDGEKFADQPMYAFLPMPDKSFLAVSRSLGFFRYYDSVFEPIYNTAGDFIKQERAIHTIKLANGGLAMATNVGVLFVDESGDIIHHVNKLSGLRDNTVWHMHKDSDGGVWCALNNGIARIELPSSLTLFDDRTNLEGTAQDIIRHNDRLYVATSPAGVYYLQAKSKDSAPFSRFMPIEEVPSQSWQFATFKNKLLVATTSGVYEINDTHAVRILPNHDDIDAACLFVPPHNSNRLFIGLFDGLASLKWVRNRWQWEGRIEDINDEIRSIVQQDDGVLWLGTRSNGLYRLQYSDSLNLTIHNLEHFSANEGLPAGQIFPFMVNGRLVITTENHGLRRFHKESNSFLPELGFGVEFSDGSHDVEIIAQNDSGTTTWFGSEEAGRVDQLTKVNGIYQIDINSLKRLPESAVRAIYPDENNILWVSTNDGLFRYDSKLDKKIQSEYNAFVRRVTILPDSLLFGGAVQDTLVAPELQHSSNSLRFEFSAVCFEAKDVIQYQTYLHGFDESWSKWSTTTFKDYTNLPPGRYTFKVRALDIYGRISQSGRYAFRILPPFYQTWGAYVFYLIVLGGLAFGIDRLQRRRLTKRARERMRVALLEAENKRKSEELEQARELQISMLPKELPQVDGATIGVFMKTATEVGGDYYDFIYRDGELTGAIGDATGHGLNAGMMVSIIKGFFVSEAFNMPILDFLGKCNLALKRMHLHNIYMGLTLFKIQNNTLTLSSAGMPPVYHYRAAMDQLEEITLPGMPLGAIRDFKYIQTQVPLQSGDVLFLMSDGFPELFNQQNEMIGYDRVPEILARTVAHSPNDIIVDLIDYSKEWAAGRVNDDDMTFVILKIK